MFSHRCVAGFTSSAVDNLHLLLVVVVAGRRSEVVEFGHLFGAQGDGAGRYVLLDPGYPFGARYRRDVVALREEPGQCDLRRCGTAFGGDG